MQDRIISATDTIAYTLFTIGAAFILLAFFHAAPWDGLGNVFICAGCVAKVRGYIVGLAHREVVAYELGRDSVRSIR